MSIDSNFRNLVVAAQSGTANSLLETVIKVTSDRTELLIRGAEAASGEKLSTAEKIKLNDKAKDWVKNQWTNQQISELKGTHVDKSEDGLETISGVVDTASAFDNGIISGLLSIAKNFRNVFLSFIESFRSDRSFSEILAERKENDLINNFAEKYSLNARSLAAELRNPTAEAIAILPPPVSVAHEQGNKKGEGNKQEPDHGNAGKSGAGKGHDEVTEVSLGNVGNPLPTSVAMSGNNNVVNHR